MPKKLKFQNIKDSDVGRHSASNCHLWHTNSMPSSGCYTADEIQVKYLKYKVNQNNFVVLIHSGAKLKNCNNELSYLATDFWPKLAVAVEYRTSAADQALTFIFCLPQCLILSFILLGNTK